MKLTKRILILLLVSVLLSGSAFLTSAQAQESEHAEGAKAAEHEETPLQTALKWANFLVLFGALGYLLRKPAKDFFETRRNDIGSGLKRAQEAQTSAQGRMDEIEERLKRLSSEVAALRTAAEKESLVEREKIVAETKREVELVVEQSRQEVERVARTVEREIKEKIADMVIDRAGNTLRTEMTQDDQKRVVVRFIKKL